MICDVDKTLVLLILTAFLIGSPKNLPLSTLWILWITNLLFNKILYFQPVRFKLNHQSTRLMAGERDCSIWVGDLTPDVDDLQLFKFFADRFNTVRTAKGNPFDFTNYFIHSYLLRNIIKNILHNLLNCTKQLPAVSTLLLAIPCRVDRNWA